MYYRNLTPSEIEHLKKSGCSAENWQNVQVADGFDPERVSNVKFSGFAKIGAAQRSFRLAGGVEVQAGIYNCHLHNVVIDNNVYINNIHNYIANYKIGHDTFIENVNIVVCDGSPSFGNGVRVPVMNETGGREIPIYDGLSAHLAYILALYRYHDKAICQLQKMIDDYARSVRSTMGTIGANVTIINSGMLKNVRIGDCAHIGGAATLKNGSINSNELAPVKIGSGVKCSDFIISSGVRIVDFTLVSRCFVGQGCIFDKHYSALDSVFFANCQGMHGEATAIFAGPYTVSHHKSSLLIAGMYSFLNAGSGSNQSNHMYKLGPIHQGVAERGAKTTSDSYLLWPARVGAFTLVMGRHTKHSDTSKLPFSYLIENATESYLVPGVNLRSVGTIRDAQKWPKRDARTDSNKIDQINFNLLSPYTIQKMYQGVDVLENLQNISGITSEEYTYQNCKIKASALKKGLNYYNKAIDKFLGNSIISRLEKSEFTNEEQMRRALLPSTQVGVGNWCDLSGLILPQTEIERLMNDIATGSLSLDDIQQRFVAAHQAYYDYEWTWAYERVLQRIGKSLDAITAQDVIDFVQRWKKSVVEIDKMLYEDAKKEFDLISKIGFGVDGNDAELENDFKAVRGTFDENPFVVEVLNHIERKSALCTKIVNRLEKIAN